MVIDQQVTVQEAEAEGAVRVMTQQEVDRYVEVSSQIASLEKEKDALRPWFVGWLGEGNKCPDAGPFVVNLCVQNAPLFTWKDICEAVVLRLQTKTDREMAERVMVQMQAEKKPRPSLLVKPNQKWFTDSAALRPPA